MIGSKHITIGVFLAAAVCYYYLNKEALITRKLHLRYDYVIGWYVTTFLPLYICVIDICVYILIVTCYTIAKYS